MGKTEAELMQELEGLQKSLKILLDKKGAIYYIDLKFFAQTVEDLKQELRIARARGD